MKAIFYMLAATLFSSATVKPAEKDIDGVWMGYYRSEVIREKVVVKFSNREKMEFFTGGVNNRSNSIGSYQLFDDSVSFSYMTSANEEIIMQGRFNNRKDFVSGVWKLNDKIIGSFYLEKQKMQELFVQP